MPLVISNMKSKTEITKSDWYKSLVDDCKAIIIEASFNSRWSLVEGYHLIGKRITKEEDKMPLKELVQHVARKTNMSTRTLYDAVRFFRKFPDLNRLPTGKNTNWRKICNEYLVENKRVRGKEECLHSNLTIIAVCNTCKKKVIIKRNDIITLCRQEFPRQE